MALTFKDYINSLPNQEESERARKIREISEACMVDRSAVYNWLNGKYEPKPLYKKIIAGVLNMPQADLFPETAQ